MFNDGSAIIIHAKGDCFTYFYEDGTKARHFIAFPPIKDNIKNKLVATVRFYNKYCATPIVLLEDVFEGEIENKSSKINKFYWKVGKENRPKFSKSGSVTYSALNGHCKIKTNPNKFLF